MDGKKNDLTLRQVLDFAIAILPVAVVLGIQYRDEIKRLQLRLDAYMHRGKTSEEEMLRQVQKEISLMEHGGGDA